MKKDFVYSELRELPYFRTLLRAVEASYFGDSRTIVKAVAGGSSRVPLGTGLVIYVEYHYSGFGVPAATDLVAALFDAEFVTRVLRGDTQILTRHALALVGSYEWSPMVAASASVVHEPTDGSGVVAPRSR